MIVGDTIIGVAVKDNTERMNLLIENLKAGEIDAILFPDTIFFPEGYFSTTTGVLFPDDYFAGKEDAPILFPDSTFQLDKGEDLYFLSRLN